MATNADKKRLEQLLHDRLRRARANSGYSHVKAAEVRLSESIPKAVRDAVKVIEKAHYRASTNHRWDSSGHLILPSEGHPEIEKARKADQELILKTEELEQEIALMLYADNANLREVMAELTRKIEEAFGG